VSSDRASAADAVRLVHGLHDWVLGLHGAGFDADAIAQADRVAVEALQDGMPSHEAMEKGKDFYVSHLRQKVARVAVVDDESDVRVLLRMFLNEERFAVVGEAANGREAVSLVDEQRPDVIVLDLNMPMMDGAEALRLIKQRWPSVKVVVHTAFGETFRPKLEGADFEAFVEKTGSFDQLADELERICT
jgi:CheY-like chemotaxis protein